MKVTVERVQTSVLPFDLAALKEHLRIDHSDDDMGLKRIGRTAAAEIEQAAQTALLAQTIRMTFCDLPEGATRIALSIGPALLSAPVSMTVNGQAFTAFDLVGGARPFLRLHRGHQIASEALVVIQYGAGFGEAPEAIPSDLAHALLDQAAMLYDGRGPQDAKALTSSPHMARIVARYRGVSM